MKIRVEGHYYFIEIDLTEEHLNYSGLKQIMCEELNIPMEYVRRIIKLPNTILRRDVEVQRMMNYTEIELKCWELLKDTKINWTNKMNYDNQNSFILLVSRCVVVITFLSMNSTRNLEMTIRFSL